MPTRITGKELEYLYVCPRKLWLFHHGIRPEMENQNVQIGLQIGEETFQRERKELKLGEIGVVDWAELRHGVIHETKKGRCPRNAEVAQVRYYLWWMRNQGINVSRCIIHYPIQRTTREIEWQESMDAEVRDDLKRAREIVARASPPAFEERKWCRGCAYRDYCMS